MPERDQTSEPVVPSSGKSWGLRFSLGAMMVIVALFAGVFGYVSYFRPARCLVSYQVVTLSVENVDNLGLKFHAIDDSPYRWAFDPEDAVTQLVQLQSQIEKPLYEKQLTVAHWPRQADTYTYVRPVVMRASTSPLPEYKSGEFAGFWGVQKAGEKLLFRVEAQVAHREPAEGIVHEIESSPLDEVSGTLSYEGELPTSSLIFAAQINKNRYQIVLINVTEAARAGPATYHPGPAPLPPGNSQVSP